MILGTSCKQRFCLGASEIILDLISLIDTIDKDERFVELTQDVKERFVEKIKSTRCILQYKVMVRFGQSLVNLFGLSHGNINQAFSNVNPMEGLDFCTPKN